MRVHPMGFNFGPTFKFSYGLKLLLAYLSEELDFEGRTALQPQVRRTSGSYSGPEDHSSNNLEEGSTSGLQNGFGCQSFSGLQLVIHPRGTTEEARKKQINKTMKPTVVSVATTFFNEGQHMGVKFGTGVIISKDGRILTSKHNLDMPGSDFKITKVKLFNGKTYVVKTIDEDYGPDLALLEIDKFFYVEPKFPYATFANAQDIEDAMNVYLISHPIGFEFSFTAGTVSCKKRLCSDMNQYSPSWLHNDTAVIQTDIASEAGSSGGPLFNSKGEIMGIHCGENGTVKLGVHVESILKFLKNSKVLSEKEHDRMWIRNITTPTLPKAPIPHSHPLHHPILFEQISILLEQIVILLQQMTQPAANSPNLYLHLLHHPLQQHPNLLQQMSNLLQQMTAHGQQPQPFPCDNGCPSTIAVR